MLIDDDGHLRRVLIGEYIDRKIDLELSKDTITESFPNVWYGPMPCSTNVKILACDSKGKITWKRIEAVTRHPVVNEDGTEDVIRVTTQSGRVVVATLGKSFLYRHNNEIIPIDGKDLTIGMSLPVSKVLPITERIQHIKFADYLPKSKFIYMSEVSKALDHKKKVGTFWWSVNSGGHRKKADKRMIHQSSSRTFEVMFCGFYPKTS